MFTKTFNTSADYFRWARVMRSMKCLDEQYTSTEWHYGNGEIGRSERRAGTRSQTGCDVLGWTLSSYKQAAGHRRWADLITENGGVRLIINFVHDEAMAA